MDQPGDISEKNEEKTFISTSSKEMPKYVSITEKWSLKSKRTLVKRLLEQIIVNRNESKEFAVFKNILPEADTDSPKLSNVRSEDFEDQAAEDLSDDGRGDQDQVVDHFLNKGKFNQKNQADYKEDKSNEEARSSWSSSEEALSTCDGALFNLPLDGSPKCHENATFEEMNSIMTNISYVADTTG